MSAKVVRTVIIWALLGALLGYAGTAGSLDARRSDPSVGGMARHPAAAGVVSSHEGSRPMDLLGNDLVPSISDPTASVVLAVIVRVRMAAPPEPGWEQGTATLQVRRVFSSPTLQNGNSLDVPFARNVSPILRVRNRLNYWNVLPMEPGNQLLLTCRPVKSSGAWIGIAGRQVQSSSDPVLSEIAECYRLEHFSGPNEVRREMLTKALTVSGSLLGQYALDSIGRRRTVTREVGSAMIEKAIASDMTTQEDRLELARQLMNGYFFETAHGADPTNQSIVSALARGFVHSREATDKPSWIEVLGSAVLRRFSDLPEQDQEIRSALICGVPTSLRAEVSTALSPQPLGSAAEESEVAFRLQNAWRNACPTTR